ncbi:MAG: protein translocase SEC61 complex subunit gamma [Promethearchaeota archaeon]
MGLRSFAKNSWRLLAISKKPDRSEVWLVTKVTLVGMTFIGVLGYLIQTIFIPFNDLLKGDYIIKFLIAIFSLYPL